MGALALGQGALRMKAMGRKVSERPFPSPPRFLSHEGQSELVFNMINNYMDMFSYLSYSLY